MEHLTKEGLKRLKEELNELKNTKRWEIAQWLREASQQGDLLENAEYMEAKESQTNLEGRISELEQRIRNSKVIEECEQGVADVGATIELTSSSRTLQVSLAGGENRSPSEGYISTESPLGRSLLGKRVGDQIEVQTPKGLKRYKVTKIA